MAEDPTLLDGLANPHARSLWMFLNAQDRFRHAEEVRFMEDRQRGRMWAGYMTDVAIEAVAGGAGDTIGRVRLNGLF